MSRPILVGGSSKPVGPSLFVKGALGLISTIDRVQLSKSMETKPETVVVDDAIPTTTPQPEIKPKRSCRHCYGRGHVGTDTKTGKKILCRCVKKAFLKTNQTNQIKDAVLCPEEITTGSGWVKKAMDALPNEPVVVTPVGNIEAENLV